MANTDVYSGSDATLTLAVEAGAEGDAANEIIEFYRSQPCRARDQRRSFGDDAGTAFSRLAAVTLPRSMKATST